MRLVLGAGFPPGDAHELAVAFSEAAANVHRHAYGGRRDGRVDLCVAIDDDRVVVTVEHDGLPFDPEGYEPPDLGRPSESGYGLYLIASLVDQVSFERAQSGGRVVLIKRKRTVDSGVETGQQGVTMAQKTTNRADANERGEPLPDLAELCRIHEIGLDLIGRSHDVDELLDRVLDEYESRLATLPSDALDARVGRPQPDSARKLRGLVMFATQAAALKEKAVVAGELKRRAAMLEEANTRLVAALDEAERSRARLDGVLAALSSGVMVFGVDGKFLTANAAARALAGAADDTALAKIIAGNVPRESEAEIELPIADGGRRSLLVARRTMSGDPGSEVVLVTDVTQRNRAVEERVRLEKLAEVLKTLSVLSHKINNPLTALLGRAQILQANRSGDPSVTKAAAVIEEASLRIAELIRELAQVVKDGHQDAVDELLDMRPPTSAAGKRR
jgi:anti-sigma regulatory factor (Ser/Thr protein kinase)/PAS domain-containing protein